MRVLLIGGAGPIGVATARALLAAGHETAILHRGREGFVLPRGAIEIVDASSPTPLTRISAEAVRYAPDAVIHVIAFDAAEAQAAVEAFRHRAGRLVMLSSGDVYRAYARFMRLEPGPPEPTPISEAGALRSRRHPYRTATSTPGSLAHRYDKIPAEAIVMGEPGLPGVVLRLPKVYGPGVNADLSTVFGFAHRPQWRWTHDHVDNVAAAIALAASHADAPGRIFNLGESNTPTMGERLAALPFRTAPPAEGDHDFTQDLDFDASAIRADLGYVERIPWTEGMARTLALSS